MLALTLKDRHDQQQTDRNGGRKCQRFAILKEMFCQRTCRHKNTTFNFAQLEPKHIHHTDKLLRSLATFL